MRRDGSDGPMVNADAQMPPTSWRSMAHARCGSMNGRAWSPYDAHNLTVCLEENSVVLHADVRAGLSLAPSSVERRAYEHERRSTANLVVMIEP